MKYEEINEDQLEKWLKKLKSKNKNPNEIELKNPGEILQAFNISCPECKSKQITFGFGKDLTGGGEGCESCGYGSEAKMDLKFLIRCRSCGRARYCELHDKSM